MLAVALGLAAGSFIALLLALYFGSTTWAWICVVMGAVGIVLSIVEAIRHHRNDVS